MTPKPALRPLLSTVVDWGLIIAAIAVAHYLSKLTPKARPFSLADPEISFPYKLHQVISQTTLYLCAVGAPIVIVIISCLTLPLPTTYPSTSTSHHLYVTTSAPRQSSYARKYRPTARLLLLNTALLSILLSWTLAYFATNGLKNLIGRPRPDLISRCMPSTDPAVIASSTVSPPNASVPLFSMSLCTQPDLSLLHDGFRSWPSGHSSYSFSGLGSAGLFLFWALSPLLHRARFPYSLVLVLIPVIPPAAAAFIAGTRFSDYRHHGLDIVSGSLIGVLAAVFGHWFYFRREVPDHEGAGGDDTKTRVAGGGAYTDIEAQRLTVPGGDDGVRAPSEHDEERDFAGVGVVPSGPVGS